MAWSVGAGLEGKGVIVTGAAGGIGRKVAEAFATTDARVMAVDLDQQAVEAVVAGMEGEGHIAVGADLRNLAVHDGRRFRRRRCRRLLPSCAASTTSTMLPKKIGIFKLISTSKQASSFVAPPHGLCASKAGEDVSSPSPRKAGGQAALVVLSSTTRRKAAL